jgi:hypothetical protein
LATILNNAMKRAYESTTYRVLFHKGHFDLIYNQNHEAFDIFLKKMNVSRVYIITAFNPFSKRLSIDKNLENNAKLESEINKLTYLETVHIDQENSWSLEHGFALFDYKKKDILFLAKRYKQNAVGSYKKEIVSLIFCLK